jgi:hypothetical protein
MLAPEFLIFLTKTFLEFICLIKILFGKFVQNKKRHEFYSNPSSSFLQFGSGEVKMY